MIPASITASLAAFQAAALAAQPYASASPLQMAALVTQGVGLLGDLDIALTAAGGPLDDATSPVDPAAMIARVLNADIAATDTTTLCDLRGYLGRAVLNLSRAQA